MRDEETIDVGSATFCGARHDAGASADAGQPEGRPEVESPESTCLTARQSRAVELLASGLGFEEVAAKLGVHRGTVFRWRQLHPAFQRELRRRTRIELSTLASRARGLLMRATQRAELALDGHGDRDAWADRVLRNRKLWDLATSAAADEEGEASDEPRR